MSYNKIKEFIKYLPEKDIPIGYKKVENKDWDSLQELVNSAIYKIKKELKKDNPSQEALNINIEALNILKTEVDMHILEISSDLESTYLDEITKLECMEYGYLTEDYSYDY